MRGYNNLNETSDYWIMWTTVSTSYEYLQKSYLSYDGNYQIELLFTSLQIIEQLGELNSLKK